MKSETIIRQLDYGLFNGNRIACDLAQNNLLKPSIKSIIRTTRDA